MGAQWWVGAGLTGALQFGHGAVKVVRNPHVRAVECEPLGAATQGEGAEGSAGCDRRRGARGEELLAGCSLEGRNGREGREAQLDARAAGVVRAGVAAVAVLRAARHGGGAAR